MFRVGVKTRVNKPKELNSMYLLVQFFFSIRVRDLYLGFMHIDKITFTAALSLKKYTCGQVLHNPPPSFLTLDILDGICTMYHN